MNKKMYFETFIFTSLILYAGLATAVPIDSNDIDFSNYSATNPYTNPVSSTLAFNGPYSDFTGVTLNNNGRILLNVDDFRWHGTLNNYGLIDFMYLFDYFGSGYGAVNIQVDELNNQSTGIINLHVLTIEILNKKINNYGTFNIIPQFGDEHYPQKQLLNIQTAGRINNYGIFRIDDGLTGQMGSSPGAVFNNFSGLFEITTRGSLETPHIYTQTNGETRVDGVLSASAVKINGGALSGNGTVNGLDLVGNSANISPGNPVGKLTITPSVDNAIANLKSLDIELGGTAVSQYDRIQVIGDIKLNATILNVRFRPGFSAGVNNSFTIINASNVAYNFLKLNLPKLSGTLVWYVQYNPGSVVLKVCATVAPC